MERRITPEGAPTRCVGTDVQVDPLLWVMFQKHSFLVYINKITTVLPIYVSNTLHADNLAIWNSAHYSSSIQHTRSYTQSAHMDIQFGTIDQPKSIRNLHNTRTNQVQEEKRHQEISPTEATLLHTLGSITSESKDSVHRDSATNT